MSQAITSTVCTTGGCNYTDVQTAIDNSSPGDTLDIYAEFFNGEIIIDRDIILQGAGETLTSLYYGASRVITINANVTVTINDLTILGGFGVDSGGGIKNSGNLTVNRTTISQNHAFISGGGIWTEGPMTLRNVTLDANSADVGAVPWGMGGGIFVAYKADLTSNNVVIIDSTISNNRACKGGGIYNGLSNITLFRTSITDNIVGMAGVTGFCDVQVTFARGGGIYNVGGSPATTLTGKIQINKSLIAGNYSEVFGGGIFSEDGGKISLTNSTISGNSVGTTVGNGAGMSNGAAIYIDDYSGTNTKVVLNNTTVTDNDHLTANPANGSAIYVSEPIAGANPTIHFRNSIVAEQASGADCGSFTGLSFISNRFNAEGGTSCGFGNWGDQQNAAPGLLPLTDNGGLTMTHALPAGSSAIDAADPTGCKADTNATGVVNFLLRRDQIGSLRTLNVCDMGAYEY